jgi:hypothetical protein
MRNVREGVVADTRFELPDALCQSRFARLPLYDAACLMRLRWQVFHQHLTDSCYLLYMEVGQMTKAQAAEIHANWHQQGEPPICVHRKIDLERSEDGYMTGNYRCTACGDSVAR